MELNLKMNRIINTELCESLRGKPCLICGRKASTVGHHWKTVGSGGDDVEHNLMALCDYHHSECHTIGAVTFSGKYQQCTNWLHKNSWRKDEFFNKWIHLGSQGWEDNMECEDEENV